MVGGLGLPSSQRLMPQGLEQANTSRQPVVAEGADPKALHVQNAMRGAEKQFSLFRSQLLERDNQVTLHELAHLHAAGHLASGGINLEMESRSFIMPNGELRTVSFANAGSVTIQVPPPPSAPATTATGRQALEALYQDQLQAQLAAEAPGNLAGGLSDSDVAIAGMASSFQSATLAALAQSDTLIEQLNQRQQLAASNPHLPPGAEASDFEQAPFVFMPQNNAPHGQAGPSALFGFRGMA